MLHYKTFILHPESDWVVLVHGAGGSSAIWFKQLRAFRKVFNVLTVDLRGHGRSKDYRGRNLSYTIPSISSDIIDVLDHLKIDAAHFVGVSLGTVLIRCLDEIAPDRIRSIVMAGAITGLNTWARFLIGVGQLLKYLVPFRTLYRTFAWIIMPGEHAREAREVFRREARKVAPAEFRRWLRLSKEMGAAVQRWAVKSPSNATLYVMGSMDYIFLPAARDLADRHDHCSLEIIEGAGHVCNVENPDVFNEKALAFLTAQKAV